MGHLLSFIKHSAKPSSSESYTYIKVVKPSTADSAHGYERASCKQENDSDLLTG